jgi:peptidoglycan/LPS O-acetylase OafA/YrhL
LIVPTVTKFALVLFQQPSWNNVLRKAVICREDSIAYGLVGAYLFNFKPAILFARKNAKMVAGVLALAILGFIFCREVTTSYYNDSKGVSFFSGTFIFSCVSFSILLTLPFFYQYKMGNNVLRICITFVSKVSYSLYLIHLFMERLSHRFFPANSVFFISARFVFFFAASFIVSALSYKFIEEKFLIIRDRIWKEKYKPA